MTRTFRLIVLATSTIATAAIFASGCVAEEPTSHEGGHGTIAWTIEGQPTSTACSRFGADEVEVRILDASNKMRSSAIVPCRDSHEVLTLDTGSYHAELILLDDSGRPISLVVATKAFRVDTGTSVVAAVDFPGCPDVRPPLPDCANATVVELRDAIGCLTGYGCVPPN
jgi:hypothetical protein